MSDPWAGGTPRHPLQSLAHVPLGGGSEFDAITAMVARWGPRAVGIGDDAAVIRVPRGDAMLMSVDASIEGRHFRREWLEPQEIGYRAVAAALSDLAAMAARPLGVLIALAIPKSWQPSVPAIADGIGEAVLAANTFVLGGNVSAASELSITTTVLGHAFVPLRRTGARAGDVLYVTGALGGPAHALAAWRGGRVPAPELRERFVRPRPRLAEARWLAAHGATSAIDISDGLVADLGHLASANGLAAEIDLALVPTMQGIQPIDAVRSGEEYELLATAGPDLDCVAFEAAFDLRLTPIGRVGAGPPRVVATHHGVRVAIAGGYDHLSR